MNKLGIALLMTVIMGSCAKKEMPDNKPVKTGKEGTELPVFNLLMAEDSTKFVNTANIGEGKTLLMLYFSPSCPHCRVQTRRLINDIERFKDVQIVFLTIANFKSMKSYYDRYGLKKYSNVTMGIDTGFVFPKYYRIGAVPFLTVFQRNKTLKQAFAGETPIDQLYRSTHEIKDVVHVTH